MWDIKESDLDKTFIGEWSITQLDSYSSQKSGTTVKNVVVRSKVDKNKNIITLYSYVAPYTKTDVIHMNGAVGLTGTIGERSKINNSTISKINTLYLHALTFTDIQKNIEKVDEGKYIIKGTCEFDDVVFNSDGNYTFEVIYHIKGERCKLLYGISIEIPIDKFNHYVIMRDLWYRDYDGSKLILFD